MTEEWRPVIGYEDHYEVSNIGRVRRTKSGRGATAGRLLKRYDRCGDGYRFVQLSKNDVKRTFGVHVLVAEAFICPRPPGKVPNHKNLIKSDNCVENLEWLTCSENAQHAIEAGRHGGRPMPGEKNGRAKLSAGQVAQIRAQKGKVGQRTLARLCGVSKTAIQKIHQGLAWPEDLREREFPR
jgi:hypothetical protein